MKCPTDLDSFAKAFWKELAPELIKSGVLNKTTRQGFISLCEAHSHYHNAESEQLKHKWHRERSALMKFFGILPHAARVTQAIKEQEESTNELEEFEL